MRGLVTLATAFALPLHFPQRDLIVLTAFAVVLATLVIQGLTLAPIVRRLGLDGDDGLADELADARRSLAEAALATLEGKQGAVSDHWRWGYQLKLAGDQPSLDAKHALGLAALALQRQRLDELRDATRIGPDAFLILQEELDFAEVTLRTEEERRIEES